MAKLRKFSAYTRLERPYTRKSKYRQKSFVRAVPTNKVIRFDMGDTKKDYAYEVNLKVSRGIQIRHNALESARQTANRRLESGAGKNNYWLKLRVYPHHILRENPLASGAGADRMSTGMKCSFGKAIGIAAQLKGGQILFSARVHKQHINYAKEALRKIYCKLPVKCKIEVVELHPDKKKESTVVEEEIVEAKPEEVQAEAKADETVEAEEIEGTVEESTEEVEATEAETEEIPVEEKKEE
jgi:large subunit ribosomal protein L10e